MLLTAGGAFVPIAGIGPDGKPVFRILFSKEPYLNSVLESEVSNGTLWNTRAIPILDPDLHTGWYDAVNSMVSQNLTEKNWMEKLPRFKDTSQSLWGTWAMMVSDFMSFIDMGTLMYSVQSKKNLIRFQIHRVPGSRKAKNGPLLDLTITPDGAHGTYPGPDPDPKKRIQFVSKEPGLAQVVPLFYETEGKKTLVGHLSFKIDIKKKRYEVTGSSFGVVHIFEN